jgi:methylenetetrahydrofolate dehydrogenase (NADP+)/methenyltetrahydrofolate cyclohydrolase
VTTLIDPSELARTFRREVREAIAELAKDGAPPKLVGIVAEERGPARTYAEYTAKGAADVGVDFELVHVDASNAEAKVRAANDDPSVHGILVYYPIFKTGKDVGLRKLVAPEKDVEGLHPIWTERLFSNQRWVDEAKQQKAILPCTPLAILKLLEAAGAFRGPKAQPLSSVRAVVFNRSEVVGHPLASMMANDGAHVTSFDIDGPVAFTPRDGGGHEMKSTPATRASALADAHVVVTGVPSPHFIHVRADEIKPGAICLNFSTLKNFDDDIIGKAGAFVPRVGPMTVTMVLRNLVRLRTNAGA